MLKVTLLLKKGEVEVELWNFIRRNPTSCGGKMMILVGLSFGKPTLG